MKAVLTVEPLREVSEDTVEAAAILHADKAHRLWWRFPARWREAVTGWSDSFLIGFLFVLMDRACGIESCRIEGRASPSLLENLDAYMSIWHSWVPERYRPVPIGADEEIEASARSSERPWIMPFSAGVDSCFTLYRQVHKLAGRRNRDIRHAVVYNGFDIWHDEPGARQIFAQFRENVEKHLLPLDVAPIYMDSNFHELPTSWGHSHGSHLISGLTLLGGAFGGALIPNNFAFHQPFRVWGSTPLIDRHLASAGFAIADDGAELSRIEKIAFLKQWPPALEHLRVCYSNPEGAGNCCRCEKCIRNILACRIAGVTGAGGGGQPGAFPREVTPAQIRAVRFTIPMLLDYWSNLLEGARKKGLMGEPWARALEYAVRRGRRREAWGRFAAPYIPLRNRIRTLFRGSAQSRSARGKGAGGSELMEASGAAVPVSAEGSPLPDLPSSV